MPSWSRASVAAFGLLACPPAQSQTPIFRANTNLRSIAVQVSSRQGANIEDLTASDFTLLEEGKPQKIAFFGTEHEPVSLAILIDTGRSMDFGGKLNRARVLLAPLIQGKRPEDEIFLMPFTDRAGPFERLTAEQRLNPPVASTLGRRGSALYDALASALCHLKTAKNVRQAVVVITDGVDEHSRLRLEQIIELARASTPQIFMVGLFNPPELAIYKTERKTVTIVGLREIDNPVIVFDRLAKESGAESFFPTSERDLKKALARISALLEAQYTLSYYPARVDQARKIEVKVRRPGVRISPRRSVGAEGAADSLLFSATACEVSPKDHPYPWESRVTSHESQPLVYHEDFSDSQSGWPNRKFDWASQSSWRYIRGGYEIHRSGLQKAAPAAPVEGVITAAADTTIAAYGPWWEDFRASAIVEAQWDDAKSAAGFVFDVTEEGYYAFVLAGRGQQSAFEFLKGSWNGRRAALLPRTPLASVKRAGTSHKLSVESREGIVTLMVDDEQVGIIQKAMFRAGLLGFGVFGNGRLTVRDLRAEALR